MAVFLFYLLLQTGFVIGSNHGFMGWAAYPGHSAIKDKKPIYNSHINREPQYYASSTKPANERSVVLQKIVEDLPEVVKAFFHTGDSSTLKHANCSRRSELGILRNASYLASPYPLHSVLDTVMHATNFLNMILQANRSREQNLRGDIEWYHALVRSILEGDPQIHRAVVTFNVKPLSSGPQVFLQATRTGGEIVLQDLSTTAHHHLKNKTAETQWYNEFKNGKKPRLLRRVLQQEIKPADSFSRKGDTYVVDKTQIKWSDPYLECEKGNYIPRWLLTLSAGFYGLKSNMAPEFRGVVRVDVNLQNVDVDQCSNDGWFAGTHRCNLNITECKPLRGHGFVLDKYKCQCKKGFYHPSRVSVNGFKRKDTDNDVSYRGELSDGASECLPCREGCSYCRDDTPCYKQEDGLLRHAIISFQGVCMLLDFISMLLAYHLRKNKSIRASGLVLLEAILFGALLLYFPVIILYFQPSVFRCILLRWVRLLGFATVYGTITLKLYRVLKVFLSRTAQRIPYLTSWRVLRLLGVILLIVCWFLAAWTSAVCQNLDRDVSLIDVGYTPDGLQFSMCLLDRWDYMMALAELIFLLWGVYLCYAVRTVPSAFHEPRYMAVAVHNELIISAIFHIIRFTLAPNLYPEWMLMLFFAHAHLTVTVTLGLLLIPKFLFAGTNPRDDIATEAYEDELDLGRSGSYLNSSITSAWSEHSLDPDDILTPDETGQLSSSNGCGVRSCDSLWEKRTNEELKKLYAQLEIYKRKKMLANNPHLQKKRSSKKGLGRSIMRRITEIPESVSRQCSKEDKDLVDHTSARNSICTLRKNPFDPGHASSKPKEESLKHKMFSIKKSHSSYDHVRDQSEESSSSATEKMEVSNTENSILDALMSKKLVKKTPDRAEAESAESVPLVCKSASAHNLTADKKPLHPRTSMLQKSLSVIASAKEKTLGLTGKTHSIELSNKHQKSQHKGKDWCKTQSGESEKSECIQKNMGNQSEEYKKSGKPGIMKHQGGGSQPSLCSDPGKMGSKDQCDISEICPWEVQDVPTTPSENKVQKHVSIAPVETTSVHGSSTKGKLQHKQKTADNLPSNSRHSDEKKVDKSEICPWEVEECQETTEGTTQANIPSLSPHFTNEKSNNSQKAEICPWDFEELPSQGTNAQPTEPHKMKHGGQNKSSAPTDVKVKGLLSDSSKSSCNVQQPLSREVCPWDYDAPESPHSEKASNVTPLSKAKDSPSKKKGLYSIKMKEVIGLERDKEKTKDKNAEKGKSKGREKSSSNKAAEKPVNRSKMAEVCAWEVESSQSQVASIGDKRKATVNKLGAEKSKQAEICPWDFEGMSESKEVDLNTCAKKQDEYSEQGSASKNRIAEVCPWDFDDQTSGKNA
nr:PREDICTED: probable G-protein coupled receptor 158 isoform X1 [Lepisosteus oculatus]